MGNDWKSLVKKYSGFQTPAVRLLVNNVDVISTLHVAIDQINLSMSLMQANSVQFQVLNAFDVESRMFSGTIKQTFGLGNILKLELGYDSDLTELFHGYIAEVNYIFQETPSIQITAFDVRRVLMESVHQNLAYQSQSYSDVFETVMKKYHRFYDTLMIDHTEKQFEQIVQKNSDYRFIQDELCIKANREFFMVGGTVYFRMPEKAKETVAALDWGEGLMSFQKRESQCNQIIRVYGMADDRKEQLSVEVRIKTPHASDAWEIMKEYQYPDMVGEAKIRRVAEAIAKKLKPEYAGGSGSCIGLPELVPGKYLRLGYLDTEQPVEYYIRQVSHSFGTGGYQTQFNVAAEIER